MRILLLEAEPAFAKFLRQVLEAAQFQVQLANGTAEARRLVVETGCDLALLDGDSEASEMLWLIAEISAACPAAGMIVLSSTRNAQERAAVLDAGADDCVTKPISVIELSARIRCVLRRPGLRAEAVLRIADLELDRLEHRVERAGRAIELTPREFALLEYLMCHVGAPIPRETLVERVWSMAVNNSTNIVDVYINYLRKKMDDGFSQRLIQTVRGVGYRLAVACPASVQ